MAISKTQIIENIGKYCFLNQNMKDCQTLFYQAVWMFDCRYKVSFMSSMEITKFILYKQIRNLNERIASYL